MWGEIKAGMWGEIKGDMWGEIKGEMWAGNKLRNVGGKSEVVRDVGGERDGGERNGKGWGGRIPFACHVRDLDGDEQLVPFVLVLVVPGVVVVAIETADDAGAVVGHVVEQQA
tara:strand:+ start:157 stop:495 length:339 start_codon:yes stop_codon:yes gene_type:complete